MQERARRRHLFFFAFSYSRLISLVVSLMRVIYPFFLGQAWAEGKGVLATCRHYADSGQ